MKDPTNTEWFMGISMLANLVLFLIILMTQTDKKPYDDYRECAKYTGAQTCFKQTIGAVK